MNEFNYNVDGFWSDKLSRRYKGGSDGPPKRRVDMSDESKWGRASIYPMIANAIEGQGFGPQLLTQQRIQAGQEGLESSFSQAKGELTSQLARTLRPEDVRGQGATMDVMNRALTTSRDDLRRGVRREQVADKSMGMDMAGTALAQEQQIGISGAQAFNNALATNMMNTQQMGTFGTNVAAGMGQGMMDTYYAKQWEGKA